MVQPVSGLYVMYKQNTPTKAVTVLAIVWYILEIVKSVIELLR